MIARQCLSVWCAPWTRMDAFVTRSPRQVSACSGWDVADLLRQGRLREAARAHPLTANVSSHVRGAFEDLRRTQLGPYGSFTENLKGFRGNRGSMIGTLIEFYLTRRIESEGYRGQEGKHETDFVHSKPTYNFELKTTSATTDDVFGNRISPTHKTGSFLLAISYDANDLEVRRIRFGWVAPSDWIPQKGNGQQSRLSNTARSNMLNIQ